MERSQLVALASAILDFSNDAERLLPAYDLALMDESSLSLQRFIRQYGRHAAAAPVEVQSAVEKFFDDYVVPFPSEYPENAVEVKAKTA